MVALQRADNGQARLPPQPNVEAGTTTLVHRETGQEFRISILWVDVQRTSINEFLSYLTSYQRGLVVLSVSDLFFSRAASDAGFGVAYPDAYSTPTPQGWVSPTPGWTISGPGFHRGFTQVSTFTRTAAQTYARGFAEQSFQHHTPAPTATEPPTATASSLAGALGPNPWTIAPAPAPSTSSHPNVTTRHGISVNTDTGVIRFENGTTGKVLPKAAKIFAELLKGNGGEITVENTTGNRSLISSLRELLNIGGISAQIFPGGAGRYRLVFGPVRQRAISLDVRTGRLTVPGAQADLSDGTAAGSPGFPYGRIEAMIELLGRGDQGARLAGGTVTALNRSLAAANLQIMRSGGLYYLV